MTVGNVIPFPDPRHEPRLRALSQTERDTHAAWIHALRARNVAVLEALDEKVPQKRIAEWCEFAPSTVTRIMSLPPSALGIDAGNDAA